MVKGFRGKISGWRHQVITNQCCAIIYILKKNPVKSPRVNELNCWTQEHHGVYCEWRHEHFIHRTVSFHPDYTDIIILRYLTESRQYVWHICNNRLETNLHCLITDQRLTFSGLQLGFHFANFINSVYICSFIVWCLHMFNFLNSDSTKTLLFKQMTSLYSLKQRILIWIY